MNNVFKSIYAIEGCVFLGAFIATVCSYKKYVAKQNKVLDMSVDALETQRRVINEQTKNN